LLASVRLTRYWSAVLGVLVIAAFAVLAAKGSALGVSARTALVVLAAAIAILGRQCITLLARSEELEHSEARFRALVQQSSDVTLIIDLDGTIRYASPAAAEVFAVDSAELIGQTLGALSNPDDATAVTRFLQTARSGADTVVAEWRVRGAQEQWIWTENTSSDMTREPAIRGIVVNCRDVSERRNLEARLTHQAYHDALTRLANRPLFLNRVGHAIARAGRSRHPAAVLFLDLDDFKKVNDSLGHAAGDELLVAAAGRLIACVRPGDTIARLGGDEFAVLLDDIAGLDDALQIAERITEAVRAPFRVHGREVFISVSIGVASIPDDCTPEDVLRNADLAMYFAKARDKGRYAIYASEMHEQLVDRLELEADLRHAVDGNDIRIEYQPIVHLQSAAVYGAEALVRWTHAKRGRVPPSRFVTVAEETGLIVPIGQRVLQEACHCVREWRGGEAADTVAPLRMSINLSGRHFREDSLVDDVRDALTASHLPPWLLTLEITESVLMHQSDITLEKLRALKGLGVQLAIDDFGTGYSSLGYLQQFPIDILKIDRTFVDGVGLEDNDPVLVRAIIALGKTLGIETIAEGIERVEQRDGLRALGCTLGQGYLFARSLSAAEFQELLKTRPAVLPIPETMGSAW
jgi:diguanylate cyclase (GGDEF)-like protein/PAS domain S-box-containing protein